MKQIYCFILMVTSFNIFSSELKNCNTVGCDLYKQEKVKFGVLVDKIQCNKGNINCDQKKLAKITKEYQQKISTIFLGDNVSESIRNDTNLEIAYAHNLEDDFKYSADPNSSALTPKEYNLNRYLCAALKGNFNCPKEVSSTYFANL